MVNKDVKHLAASASAKKPRPKAKRKAAVRGRKKKPVPGWVWLLAGLGLGLLLAGGVYLMGGSDPAPAPESPVARAPVKTEPEPATTEPASEDEENYAFYHLLSKLEVVIPESEIKKLQEDLAPREDVAYILQAGSFRRFDDADSVKAQLALLGIEADVQQIESRGEQWYRVRVGPFKSKRKLNKIRNHIQAADIDTMVIKIRRDQKP